MRFIYQVCNTSLKRRPLWHSLPFVLRPRRLTSWAWSISLCTAAFFLTLQLFVIAIAIAKSTSADRPLDHARCTGHRPACCTHHHVGKNSRNYSLHTAHENTVVMFSVTCLRCRIAIGCSRALNLSSSDVRRPFRSMFFALSSSMLSAAVVAIAWSSETSGCRCAQLELVPEVDLAGVVGGR